MLDYSVSAPELACTLIGYELTYTDTDGNTSGGIIVETEAYDALDPASHSYGGTRKRNLPMFMRPGTIYIYQIYGIHRCLNIVAGNHDGQAVLIRSLAPTVGIELMKARRNTQHKSALCSGPAKLFQALGIVPTLNGQHLDETSLSLRKSEELYEILTLPRIGITKAVDTLWRFVGTQKS